MCRFPVGYLPYSVDLGVKCRYLTRKLRHSFHEQTCNNPAETLMGDICRHNSTQKVVIRRNRINPPPQKDLFLLRLRFQGRVFSVLKVTSQRFGPKRLFSTPEKSYGVLNFFFVHCGSTQVPLNHDNETGYYHHHYIAVHFDSRCSPLPPAPKCSSMYVARRAGWPVALATCTRRSRRGVFTTSVRVGCEKRCGSILDEYIVCSVRAV